MIWISGSYKLCEQWCKYRRESLRKLCVAYNNIFRKLTHQARDCSASQMFVSRQLPAVYYTEIPVYESYQ